MISILYFLNKINLKYNFFYEKGFDNVFLCNKNQTNKCRF